MVFVVNDLTWFEQKYVVMLHQKYVQCKQHKEPGSRGCFVFHNVDTSVSAILVQTLSCADPVCIPYRVVSFPCRNSLSFTT